MKRNPIIILLAVLVIIVGFFVLRDREIVNYPPKEGPIVAFGDSLVVGVGSSKGKDFISLLSTKVGMPIINLGVSGDTTAGGLSRIDEVLKKEPSIVIVVLGGNDFLRKVPREETFSNLRQIVRRIQSEGSIVVLVGVRDGLLSDRADELYEALAEETGSVYVSNILEGLFGDQRYMSDSVHPNDVGYEIIAERLEPVIGDLLR